MKKLHYDYTSPGIKVLCTNKLDPAPKKLLPVVYNFFFDFIVSRLLHNSLSCSSCSSQSQFSGGVGTTQRRIDVIKRTVESKQPREATCLVT